MSQPLEEVQSQAELAQAVSRIEGQLDRLQAHKFVASHNSWIRLVWFNLVRGLAFGLGSVLGATVLVSVLIYFLSQIDFVPILGDYANRILDMLDAR